MITFKTKDDINCALSAFSPFCLYFCDDLYFCDRLSFQDDVILVAKSWGVGMVHRFGL